MLVKAIRIIKLLRNHWPKSYIYQPVWSDLFLSVSGLPLPIIYYVCVIKIK